MRGRLQDYSSVGCLVISELCREADVRNGASLLTARTESTAMSDTRAGAKASASAAFNQWGEIESRILLTLYNTVQLRSISSRGRVRETHIHHSCSHRVTMATTLFHHFISPKDIYHHKYSFLTVRYMCHTVPASRLYAQTIYLKEKYCFCNIPGEDLLSLVCHCYCYSF